MYIRCNTAVISKTVRLCGSVLEHCLFMSQSTLTVCHYIANYWPGMHTPAFSVVCVNIRRQKEDLCVSQ